MEIVANIICIFLCVLLSSKGVNNKNRRSVTLVFIELASILSDETDYFNTEYHKQQVQVFFWYLEGNFST